VAAFASIGAAVLTAGALGQLLDNEETRSRRRAIGDASGEDDVFTALVDSNFRLLALETSFRSHLGSLTSDGL
jgi:hypothetical protein